MLVEEIKNRWSILKDEIKKMSEDEKEIEKPDKILKIVKEILDFNKEIQEGGLGLKILKMKLKMKLRNYCILCTDQKNLFIKVW